MESLDKILSQAIVPGQETGPAAPTLGWAEGLNQESAAAALKDPQVLADMEQFYKTRDGASFQNSSQLLDYFYKDRNFRGSNTVGMGKDVWDAYHADPQQAGRMARMQVLFDALPQRDDLGKVILDTVPGLVADPLNLIGFGAGGAAGKVAMRGLAKEGVDLTLGASIKAGIKHGIISEGLSNAAVSTAQDALLQARDTEIGLQDGYSPMRSLEAAGTGALLGGTLGGVTGGVGGAFSGMAERDVIRKEQALAAEKAAQVASEPPPTPPADTPPAAPAVPTSSLGSLNDQQVEKLEAAKTYLEDEINRHQGDTAAKISNARAWKIKLDALNQNLDALNTVRNWDELRAKTESEISDLQAEHASPAADAKSRTATRSRLEALQSELQRRQLMFDRIKRNIDRTIPTEDVVDAVKDGGRLSEPLTADAKAETNQANPDGQAPEAAPANPDQAATQTPETPATTAPTETPAPGVVPADFLDPDQLQEHLNALQGQKAANEFGVTLENPVDVQPDQLDAKIAQTVAALQEKTGVDVPSQIEQDASLHDVLPEVANPEQEHLSPTLHQRLADAAYDHKAVQQGLVNEVKRARRAGDTAAVNQARADMASLRAIKSQAEPAATPAPAPNLVAVPAEPRTTPKASALTEQVANDVTQEYDPTPEGLEDFARENDLSPEVVQAQLEASIEAAREAGGNVDTQAMINQIMIEHALDIEAGNIMDEAIADIGMDAAYDLGKFGPYVKASGKAGDLYDRVMRKHAKWLKQRVTNVFYSVFSANPGASIDEIFQKIEQDYGENFRREVVRSVYGEPTGQGMEVGVGSDVTVNGLKTGEKPRKYRFFLSNVIPNDVRVKAGEMYDNIIDRLWQGAPQTNKSWNRIVSLAETNVSDFIRRETERLGGNPKSIGLGVGLSGDSTGKISEFTDIPDYEPTASYALGSNFRLTGEFPGVDAEALTNINSDTPIYVGEVTRVDPATGHVVLVKDIISGRIWERGLDNSWKVSGKEQSFLRSNERGFFGRLFPKSEQSDLGLLNSFVRLFDSSEEAAARGIEQSNIDAASGQIVKSDVKRVKYAGQIAKQEARVKEITDALAGYNRAVDAQSQLDEVERQLQVFAAKAKLGDENAVTADPEYRRLTKIREKMIGILEKNNRDELAKIVGHPYEIGLVHEGGPLATRARINEELKVRRALLATYKSATKKEEAGLVAEEARLLRGHIPSQIIAEFGHEHPTTPKERRALRRKIRRRAKELRLEKRKDVAPAIETVPPTVADVDAEAARMAEAERARESAPQKQQEILQAVDAFKQHGDIGVLTKQLEEINQKYATPSVTGPDMPMKAKNPPMVVNHGGIEVDLNGDFSYTQLPEGRVGVKFLGAPVGHISINKDGSLTLAWAKEFGVQSTANFQSREELKRALPKIYDSLIKEAADNGQLTRAVSDKPTNEHPLNWRQTNKYREQAAVPAEASVAKPVQAKPVPTADRNSFNLPEGTLLAVRNKNESRVERQVRVEAVKKVKSGQPQTVADMVGKWGNHEIGFVPEGTPSNSKTASELFRPIGELPDYMNAAPEDRVRVKQESQPERKVLTLDNIKDVVIDPLDVPEWDRSLNTLQAVHDRMWQMENTGWPDRTAEMVQHVQRLNQIYDIIQKYAPNGIKYPSWRKRVFYDRVAGPLKVSTDRVAKGMRRGKSIFSSYSEEERLAVMDIIGRVTGMGETIPPIVELADDGSNTIGKFFFPDSNNAATRLSSVTEQIGAKSDQTLANAIGISNRDAEITPGVAAQPVSMRLIHELGHWSYANLLSIDQRRDFWNIMLQNYYGKDALMAGRLTGRNITPGHGGVTKSPAELWADQYTMYFMKNGRVGIDADNELYWRGDVTPRDVPGIQGLFGSWANRMSELIKDAAKKIMGLFRLQYLDSNSEAALELFDRDLVPILDALLPSEDDKGIASIWKLNPDLSTMEFKTNRGKLLTSAISRMDDWRKQLYLAMRDASPERLDQTLNDVSRDMKGYLFGWKNKRPTDEDFIQGLSRENLFQTLDIVHKWMQENSVHFRQQKGVADIENALSLSTGSLDGEAKSLTEALTGINLDRRDYTPEQHTQLYILSSDLSRELHDAQVAVAREWQKAEGRSLRVDPQVDADAGNIVRIGTPEERMKRGAARGKAAAAHKQRNARLEREAKQVAAEISNVGHKNDPKPAAAPKAAAFNAKTATNAQLFQRVRDGNGGKAAIVELRQRLQAGKINVSPEMSPELASAYNTIKDKTNSALSEAFFDAVKKGDGTRVRAIAIEYNRRAATAIGNGQNATPLLSPSNMSTLRWLGQEISDSHGVGNGGGIPASTRPDLADLVSKVTNRDARTDAIAKTLAYRLFNMIGRAEPGTLDAPNAVTSSDLMKIAGTDGEHGKLATSDSAEFNSMRDLLRVIATSLTAGRSVSPEVSAQVGSLMTRLTMNDADVANITRALLANGGTGTEKDAIDWFGNAWANYVADNVGRAKAIDAAGNLERTNPILAAKLGAQLDTMTEQAAYLLNGLLGNDSARRAFRHTSWYGDMFSNIRRTRPVSDVVSMVDGVVPPIFASDTGHEALTTKTGQQLARLSNWAGVSIEELNRHIMSRPVDGELARSPDGVYLLDSAEIASPETLVDVDTLRSDVMASGKDIPEKSRLLDQISALEDLNSQLAQAYRTFRSTRSPEAVGTIRFLNGQIDGVMSDLRTSVGVDIPSAVQNVLVKDGNFADLSSLATYQPGDSFVRRLTDSLVAEGLVSPDAASRVSGSTISGAALRDVLANAISARTGVSREGAQRVITGILKENGYHGVNLDHGSHGATLVFNEADVRPVDDDFLDLPDQPEDAPDGAPKFGGEFTSAIMDTSHPINPKATYPLAVDGQNFGVPADLVGLMKKMLRQEQPTVDDMQTPARFGAPLQLVNNSGRLRKTNQNVLAKYGEELYPMVHQMTGRDIADIYDILGKLPDAGGFFKKWFRHSRPFFTLGYMDVGQPASHDRIFRALDSGDFTKLQPEEAAAAKKIASFFDAKLSQMRDAGVKIGDIRKKRGGGYVTIVWNNKAMEEKPEAAISAFAKAFTMEWDRMVKDGQVTKAIDPAEAQARAKKLVLKLIDDDAISHLDEHGSLGNAQIDMAFQRVLAFTPEEMDKAGLYDFVHHNLMGIVAKYSDAANRRIVNQRWFGTRNFGFDTYKLVRDFGIDGVAQTLMSNKILRSRFMAPGLGGGMEDNELVGRIYDRITSNPAEARRIADEIFGIIKDGGGTEEAKRAAFDQLMSYSRTDLDTLKDTQLRAKMIVEGLADFGDQGNAISQSEREWTDDMMASYQGRPFARGAFHRPLAHTSKFLRNFNAVTLLPYATVASFPDLVMPLIRSGNMKAWLSGFAKFAGDDAYRKMMRNVGVSIENIVHDSLATIHGTDGSGISNAMFHANLLNPWTDMTRQIAGAVGHQSLIAEQERAMRMIVNGQTNTRQYRQAMRYLRYYGLDDYARPGAKLISDQDVVANDDRIRMAIIKFANEAVFAPNHNDIPLWAQTPVGSIIFQLKSYPLMAAKLAAWTVKEFPNNPKPLLYLLSAGAAFGAGTSAVRDIAQSRGGQDQQSRQFRIHNTDAMAAEFGWKKDSGTTSQDFLSWYVEGLISSGGLGMIGDLLYNQAAQIDNGAYGQMRVLSYIFGPSVGDFTGAMNIASGAEAAIGGADGTGRQRQAVREIAQRIPFIGGQKDIREAIVKSIAGDKTATNSDPWER